MPVDYVVRNHFYSVFFAPRGRVRMYEIGIKNSTTILNSYR